MSRCRVVLAVLVAAVLAGCDTAMVTASPDAEPSEPTMSAVPAGLQVDSEGWTDGGSTATTTTDSTARGGGWAGSGH